MRLPTLVAVLSCVLAPLLRGQQRVGARPTLPREEEIALARSAAPSQISAKARVWVWTGTEYVVADSGTSSVNCYVGRPWTGAIEPHCMDAEGSATILPIQMRRVALFARGVAEAEVEREIAEGIKAGKYRLPSRPAFTYMMSASQSLVTATGHAIGAWQPHLMIYYPNLNADQSALPGFVPGIGLVDSPDTPYSAFVIPVKEFVK